MTTTAPALRANQWFSNGDHPDDGPTGREGEVVRYFRHPDVLGSGLCPCCHHTVHEHGWIDSGPSGRTVCPGDWIITAADGHHYPVSHAALIAIYGELKPL